MKSKLFLMAAVASLAVAGTAQTFTHTFDVSGTPSFGAYGDAGNTVWMTDVSTLPGAVATVDVYTIVALDWEVVLTAHSPSWISEILMAFENSDNSDFYDMQPGPGDNAPGAGIVKAGSVDLLAAGDEVTLLADHMMRNEFWEGFDDSSVAPDGNWDQGSVTVTYAYNAVPEPATMVALGLGAAALIRRRKK